METIKAEAVKIVSKDLSKIQSLALAAYDATKITDKGKDKDKELALSKKSSPTKGKFWRLVYKAKTKETVTLFEETGPTWTAWDLFCGTKEECIAEIAKLGLTTTKIKPDKLVVEKAEL